MNAHPKSPFRSTLRRSPLLRAASLLPCGLLLAWAWRAAPPGVTRGPYLQSLSATAVTVVFRTDAVATATVRYGAHAGIWEGSKSSASATTHAVQLTGLRPDTRYSYQVESGGSVLAGGEDHFFHTSPPENARTPFRFVAWGDSGNGSSTQTDVAKRMEEVVPQPDLAFGLGDLVYDTGQWENYDPRLFRPYAKIFTRMAFWPTLGNHDYATQNGAPYLDAFYLPTTSGAPGHPSNTEKYYSFDHGMAHFVCADSESSSSSPGSAMYTWISDDLDNARQRGKRWLIVFMHHPPYSHGTHNSDTDPELITLRQNLVPLFDAKGVDMVMVGHSHVYERSYLAKNSSILQHDSRDYTKIGSPNGTIYLVSGCGGESGSGSLDHPLMSMSRGNVAGFNLVDVTWEDLRGSFVERDGRTTDLFRLHKSADVQPPRIATARALGANEVQVVFDEPVRAGTAPGGAENPGLYVMLEDAAVRQAVLESDQRTVKLSTTDLNPHRGYMVSVTGVKDLAGNLLSSEERAYFRREDVASSGGGGSGGGTTSTAIARGATWRYRKGVSPAAVSWAARDYDDSTWSQGRAAFGYDDSGDYRNQGTVLSDMKSNYASIYLRASFTVSDPSLVSALALGVAYDDGFVAYLNGTEIARGNMLPGPVVNTTMAATSHEVVGYQPFDASQFARALVPGRNVLAIEGHNFTLASPDFWLDPELTLTTGTGTGTASRSAPVAVLDGDVFTANAPARIAFSAARSWDADGDPLRFVWDFGDGTRAYGPSVSHLFPADGSYAVYLFVRDSSRFDAVERHDVRIHSIGNAPSVQLGASSTRIAVGGRVDFASSGSFDPDGGPTYVSWSFGDPSSGEANASTAASVSHVFAHAGVYTVRLAVTDDEASTAMRTVTITVQ